MTPTGYGNPHAGLPLPHGEGVFSAPAIKHGDDEEGGGSHTDAAQALSGSSSGWRMVRRQTAGAMPISVPSQRSISASASHQVVMFMVLCPGLSGRGMVRQRVTGEGQQPIEKPEFQFMSHIVHPHPAPSPLRASSCEGEGNTFRAMVAGVGGRRRAQDAFYIDLSARCVCKCEPESTPCTPSVTPPQPSPTVAVRRASATGRVE